MNGSALFVACAAGCSTPVHTDREPRPLDLSASIPIDAGVVVDAEVSPDAAEVVRYGKIGWGNVPSYRSLHHRVIQPTLALGTPTVQSGLEAPIVRRYVKREAWRLEYCYERKWLATPDLAGSVTTEFTIARDGSVVVARATGLDPEVERCIERVLEAIEFPKPETGLSVEVSYPLIFRPPT